MLATSSCQLDFKRVTFRLFARQGYPITLPKGTIPPKDLQKRAWSGKLYVVIILLREPAMGQHLSRIKNPVPSRLICIMLIHKKLSAGYWKKLKKIYIFTKSYPTQVRLRRHFKVILYLITGLHLKRCHEPTSRHFTPYQFCYTRYTGFKFSIRHLSIRFPREYSPQQISIHLFMVFF